MPANFTVNSIEFIVLLEPGGWISTEVLKTGKHLVVFIYIRYDKKTRFEIVGTKIS